MLPAAVDVAWLVDVVGAIVDELAAPWVANVVGAGVVEVVDLGVVEVGPLYSPILMSTPLVSGPLY